MKRINLIAFVACLVLVACGGQDDAGLEQGEYENGGSSVFDASQLPDDFPRELIPTTYDSGSYAKLGQVESATFESSEPVGKTIDHYVELLGDPATRVGGDGSDASAQWRTTPWAVSILGNDSESIIGFTKADP